jgi:hypothetical protein
MVCLFLRDLDSDAHYRVSTGGFLVTHGVYSGPEDFKDKIVRHFMVRISARRMISAGMGVCMYAD